MPKSNNITVLAECIAIGIVAFGIVSFPQGLFWLGLTIYFAFWSAGITTAIVLLLRERLERISRRSALKLLWAFLLVLLVLLLISNMDRYSNDTLMNVTGIASIGLSLSLFRYRVASGAK